VPSKDLEDITRLLVEWNNGDEAALQEFVRLVYPELRRIARRQLARQPADHTLESAALVHEAYVKLVRARGIRFTNRAHFFAVCAQMIRRILVDYARSRRYDKRGGGLAHVSLDEALLGMKARGIELLALDEALESLARIDPRKARVVELRFFGGLSVQESAGVLEVSAETVMRDWRFAKSWLGRHLRHASTQTDS
jgi:RNA polymerase sigma factor (TIGR02999 family)